MHRGPRIVRLRPFLLIAVLLAGGAASAADNDNRISTFILGVVRSPAFQMSRAPTNTEDGAEEDGPAQVEHPIVGLGDRGHVVEHQQHARHRRTGGFRVVYRDAPAGREQFEHG